MSYSLEPSRGQSYAKIVRPPYDGRKPYNKQNEIVFKYWKNYDTRLAPTASDPSEATAVLVWIFLTVVGFSAIDDINTISWLIEKFNITIDDTHPNETMKMVSYICMFGVMALSVGLTYLLGFIRKLMSIRAVAVAPTIELLPLYANYTRAELATVTSRYQASLVAIGEHLYEESKESTNGGISKETADIARETIRGWLAEVRQENDAVDNAATEKAQTSIAALQEISATKKDIFEL